MIRLGKKKICALVLASDIQHYFKRVAAQVTIWINGEEFIIDRDFIVEYRGKILSKVFGPWPS